MAKKIVKKTKIKLFNILLILLFFAGTSFLVYFSLKLPIYNIIVNGNSYLNDDYIIRKAGIYDYPSFFLTMSSDMKRKINKSPYIESSSIRKRFGLIVDINIVENRGLFFDSYSNKYILSDMTKVKEDDINCNFRVPRLLNYVPDIKYDSFVKNMARINLDSLEKISDIEYVPNDYDKDRFLLYMDDGNLVYLTLTKFKMINHYNDVLTQLENHHGILYLDSGNHFKIME